jgi:formylglycine-generating enzyme
VLERRAAQASAIFLAAAATALGFACSFAVDDFKRGDATVDTGRDTLAIDAAIDSFADMGLDVKPDVRPDVDTNKPEVDMGPPDPPPGCTTVGPPETVCIAAGEFNLGAVNTSVCPPSGCAPEMPKAAVKVSQFHIDKFEVTVKRFRAWWNMSPRPFPAAGAVIFTSGTKDLRWRNTWPTTANEPPTSGCTWLGASNAANDDKPISCVDWYTALAFCMSEGKRLPTEAEWELVASGGEERLYPWSDPDTEDGPIPLGEIDCPHVLQGSCNPLNTATNTTVWGRSRWGVWNLAGSLSEWTLDAYASNWSGITAGSTDPITDPTTSTSLLRAARGGSFLSKPETLRAAYRPPGTDVKTPDSQIGFRCAKRL